MGMRRTGQQSDETLVWSSDQGRASAPARSTHPEPASGPTPPADGVVRISRTKAGRGGKTVTLCIGVPAADAPNLTRELRRLCGSGGALKGGIIEIQGDHRERLADALGARYRVKLAGG